MKEHDVEKAALVDNAGSGIVASGTLTLRWWPDPKTLSDADLLARYHASEAEAGDPEMTAMCAELERRGLDF